VVSTRGNPDPATRPSSPFRTTSTVCSTSGLAGLFHPAAAFGVSLQGFDPGAKPCGLSPAAALLSFAPLSPPRTLRGRSREVGTLAFRALLRAPIRGSHVGLLAHARAVRSPPGLVLPRVLIRASSSPRSFRGRLRPRRFHVLGVCASRGWTGSLEFLLPVRGSRLARRRGSPTAVQTVSTIHLGIRSR
jgi:hypothetical protein